MTDDGTDEAAGAPRELVIDAKPAPGDASDSGGSAMAPVAVPVIAAGFLAKYVSLAAGGIALGLAVVLLVARRRPREGLFVLRVEGASLEVTRQRAEAPPVRLALHDVLDVTLDRHVRPGARGGSIERVRLAIERRAPESPLFVPAEHLTPFEAQEWHAKVRVFLRKHGWVPEDER